MVDDPRIYAVTCLIRDYVRSPSLKHIRDAHSINKLARDIVRRLDGGTRTWRNWTDERELLLKSALTCWIPEDDLREFLNSMPGPVLTRTDVAQRRRALEEEEHTFPDERFQAASYAIFAKEKAAGTEMPAIIGRLVQYIEDEEVRLLREREQRWRVQREAEKAEKLQWLRSGADCKWTQVPDAADWWCRVNGRTYRLSIAKDRRQQLYRVDTLDPQEKGLLLGTYQRRGDATKAVNEMAYLPEPRRG